MRENNTCRKGAQWIRSALVCMRIGSAVAVTVLSLFARHGRLLLVMGLIAGAGLPELAQLLRPWLPQCVGLLLLLTAMRVGHKAALGSLSSLRRVALIVSALQVGAPLLAVGVLSVAGLMIHPFTLAVVLMLAAPSVTGAPNFLIMMGQEPSDAMRILVFGTAVFPVTVIPVLWALPVLDSTVAIWAALRLIVVILGATALGFLVRHTILRGFSDTARISLDGLSALALAVIVVGLMSEIGPLLRSDPVTLLKWAAAVLALNFGLQIATHLALRGRDVPEAPAISIISGNRNIALFLIALPPEATGPLLLFIGCYQIPMYLTPLVMRRMYLSRPSLFP